MNNIQDNSIDIVIPWVDGQDEAWLLEKNNYSQEITKSVHSFDYQDWDILKYWFRGIEKNMPWIRKIFFVTWGHIPKWLNTDHPQLVIIRHEDYLPDDYRPTFSANPIEINFHRIPGLSERFVYFNDDMFVLKKTTEKDFFNNGLPCDSAIINPIAPANNNCIAHMQLTNAAVINQHFSKHKVIKDNFFKWFNIKYGLLGLLNCLFIPWGRFPGLLEQHLPTSFLKSSYLDVWEKEYALMHETSKHRFRNFKVDVNQWLIKEWQIVSGNFHPRSPGFGKLLAIRDVNSAKKAVQIIQRKKYKVICVNDHLESGNENLERIIAMVKKSFDIIFPEKSLFEK